MADKDDELSRRELMKRTGVTLGTIALGVGCSDPEESDDKAPNGNAGQDAAGTSGTGQGGAGNPSQGGRTSAGSGSGGVAGTKPAGGSGMQAAGTTASNAGTTDTAGSGSGTGAGEGGGGGGSAGTTASNGKVRVAIVKKPDLDEAVARAVELAGGIDEIQAGQTVFIKINAVSNRAIGMPGIRTSNEVMAAVVRLVKKRNPGKIIVGDHSARSFVSETVFDEAGITTAAMAAGADEVYPAPRRDQDPSAWMLVKPDGYEQSWQGEGGIYILSKIADADHLINVPTCKNHEFALFSLSQKNFIGAIEDSSRAPIHYLQSGTGDFLPIGRDIAIINGAFSPLINILDATTMILNGGPYGDGANTVRISAGRILASRDRLALDATGVSMMKFELGRNTVSMPDPTQTTLKNTKPWMMPQIAQGIMRKIGVDGPDKVELMFDGVDEATDIEAVFRS